MADTGAQSPGTMANDETVGDTDWSSEDEAKASDDSWAVASRDVANPHNEYSIRLVKGGTIQGDEKSTAAQINAAPEAYKSYGGAAVMWGLALSEADVEAADFGVVFSNQIGTGETHIWHYLKATNFGFTIPTDATIDGVLVEVEMYQYSPYRYVTRVDHIRMTVYYTEAGWSGTVNGVTNPAKVLGVAVADIVKVNGVA